jgi:hypothetical protein
MTKHGHFAEIAIRQCLCQGVFTQPRPNSDICRFEEKSNGVPFHAAQCWWGCNPPSQPSLGGDMIEG